MPPEAHVLRLAPAQRGLERLHVRTAASPVTARLLQAESTLVNAFNVHALTRAIDDFQPDVAYVWMLVGVGGLGLMATLQHLGVPWLWHLMDDVPVALCRLGGRVVEPLLREVDRQLDGTLPGLLAAAGRGDRGRRVSGSGPTSRSCPTGSSARPRPLGPGSTSPARRSGS